MNDELAMDMLLDTIAELRDENDTLKSDRSALIVERADARRERDEVQNALAEIANIVGLPGTTSPTDVIARVRETDGERFTALWDAANLRVDRAEAEAEAARVLDAIIEVGEALGCPVGATPTEILATAHVAFQGYMAMRYILAGSAVAPTDAQIVAHEAVGGTWRRRVTATGQGMDGMGSATARMVRDRAGALPGRWWAEDRSGVLCAMPTAEAL